MKSYKGFNYVVRKTEFKDGILYDRNEWIAEVIGKGEGFLAWCGQSADQAEGNLKKRIDQMTK